MKTVTRKDLRHLKICISMLSHKILEIMVIIGSGILEDILKGNVSVYVTWLIKAPLYNKAETKITNPSNAK